MNDQQAWPAGWYPDPERNAPYRYYNGTRWTDRYRDARPLSVPALSAIGACVGLAIGAIGPWITIGVISADGLGNGRDGQYTLGFAIVASLVTVLYMGSRHIGWAVLALIIGLAAISTAVADIQDVQSRSATLFGTTINANVGWGLWLTAVAAVALAASALGMALGRARAGFTVSSAAAQDTDDVPIVHPQDSAPWPEGDEAGG